MTKFEYLINGGQFANRTIEAVIIDLSKNETFSANINAETLQEIDKKLPLGYEMDKISTLSNYFEPNTMEKFEIELKNSQFVYFANFHDVLTYGIYDYTSALEKNDFKTTEKLDRQYQG